MVKSAFNCHVSAWMAGLVMTGTIAAASGAENVKLTIPRLDGTSVQLDGRLDEPMWQQAAQSDDFVLTGSNSGAPVQATRVRMFYDAEALYLGFECQEQDMERVVLGLPADQTVNAPIASTDDALELFINHNGDPHTYYHLRITPSGSRDDAAVYKPDLTMSRFDRDTTWHGDWQVRTQLGESGWTVEVRIAWPGLAAAQAYAGTPASGEVWSLQFGRVASAAGEFSVWHPTPTGLFHSPQHFGRVAFSGRQSVVVDSMSMDDAATGRGYFQARVSNASADLPDAMLWARLAVNESNAGSDSPQWTREIPLTLDKRGQASIDVEVPFTAGGDVAARLELAASETGPPLHVGQWRGRFLPIPVRLDEVSQALKAVEAEQADLPLTPAVTTLRAEIAEVAATLESLRRQAGPASERLPAVDAVEQRAATLERRFWNRVRPLAKGHADTGPPTLAVGVEHPHRKVFREDSFRGEVGGEVRLEMALNESQSAQLVLLPLDDQVSQATCEIGPLTHTSDSSKVIRPHFIEVATIGYVDVGHDNFGHRSGAWPDVIYPDATTALRPDRVQPMLVTVQTQPYFEPGEYRTTITVTPDRGEPVELPLVVEVWPFALPDRKTMRTNFWFWQHRPMSVYGSPWEDRVMSPQMFEHWAQVKGRYHMAPAPRHDILAHKFRLVRKADGAIEMDFSRMLPYWEAAIANGATVLNVDLFSADYFRKPEHPWQVHAIIIDEQSGEEQPFVADDPEAMARRYLRELVELFRERNWLRYAVYLAGDEPWNSRQQETFRRKAAHLRSVTTEVPITGAGTVPQRMGLDDTLDIWCPQFLQYRHDDYVDSDKGLWFYQCLYKPGFPMFMIDRPGIEPRIAFWVCWKAGADGFIYWTTTMWDDDQIRQEKLRGNHGMDRWIHEQWKFPMPTMPGDGAFFYPQPHRVVASLRAMAIRDGVEDYEYLAILRSRASSASAMATLDADERDRVEALLALPDKIVAAPDQWTDSPEKLDAIRAEVAHWITRLSD